MSLREYTKDLHTKAEQTNFMKLSISGKLPKELYINYLWQMIPIYSTIEFGVKVQEFFSNSPGIDRTKYIYQDFTELADKDTHYSWLPETLEYIRYLQDLLNDPNRKHLIKAHFYVHHLGTLNGGQYIAKTVPGSGKFYQFDDVDGLRNAIRAELTDELGDEARVAFEWAIKIMEALDETN